MFDLIDVKISDVIDVLLVGILLYQIYRLLKGTLAFHIFVGLAVIYWVAILVKALEMRLLANLLGQFLSAGFVLLAIVFQPEIRRFLFYIGKGSGIGNENFLKRLLSGSNQTHNNITDISNEIIKSLNNMSGTKTGALIVLIDSVEKAVFQSTGVPINGHVSSKLLESIFDKGSPLHDGAVVISEGRIMAAGCVLPISESPELPKRVGMRHRAAVGLTEQLDADVLIVSEQTGKIAHSRKGKLRIAIPPDELQQIVLNALSKV
jgi:diadenylate cyclase